MLCYCINRMTMRQRLTLNPTHTAPAFSPQVLLAGWGEVAHSVAMRAYECSDEEWAVRDPALARCTGRYWVVSGG